MQILRFLFVALSAICLSGCIPESKNPLSAPEDSTADLRLAGVWTADSGGDKIYLHFGKGKGHTMDAVEVDHEKGGAIHANDYTVFTTVIEGVNYLNIRAATGENHSYYFARYGVDSEDVLRVWLMSDEPVAKAIKAGKLKGTVANKEGGKDIKITDTAAKITRFIRESDRAVLFAQQFGTFHRIDGGASSGKGGASAQ